MFERNKINFDAMYEAITLLRPQSHAGGGQRGQVPVIHHTEENATFIGPTSSPPAAPSISQTFFMNHLIIIVMMVKMTARFVCQN